MQDKLKEEHVELKEVCDVCGKTVAKSGVGSLTSWIFGRDNCACKITGGASGQTPQPSASLSRIDKQAEAPIDNTAKPELGDNYEILEKLGQGGMGAVYKVKDLVSNKIFAVKVLNEDLCRDKRNVERFENEIKASMSLSHPNLVTVYKQGTTTSGAPYLLMDFLEGEDLSHFLKREGCIPTERAIDLFHQICEAFNHAHAKGIVHRDIKPGNIIISKTEGGNDYVKIVDFGIAKILPSAGETMKQLTQTGELIGSPYYMSPEQCRGEELDARSDIYSLGCVMYEVLSGKTPFDGSNPVKIILQHLNGLPKPFDSFLSVGADLEEVIMTCLRKSPSDRYQSVHEIMIDLDRIRSGQKPMRRIKAEKSANSKKLKRLLVYGFAAVCVALSWFALDITFNLTNPWLSAVSRAQEIEAVGESHYPEAEQVLKQAFAEATAHNAPNGDKAKLLYELGRLYTEWPRKTQALRTFKQALEFSDATANVWETATIYDYLCFLNNENDRPIEAKYYGEKALDLRTKLKSPRLIGNTLLHLSHTYVLLGDYDKAEQLASRAVALEEQLHPAKDDPLVGDAYYNVACSILNRPAPDSAKLDIAGKAAKQAVSIWLAADGPTSSTVDAADWLSRELTHHKRAGQAKSISQLIEAAKNQ
jgi:serine/threonine protein kinase